jgi:hypothetical protein
MRVPQTFRRISMQQTSWLRAALLAGLLIVAIIMAFRVIG